MDTPEILKKEEIKVPERRVNYTFPPWSYRLRAFFFALTGIMGGFGVAKWPVINESTKIADAAETIKHLDPAQLAALQGVQITNLERKVDENKKEMVDKLDTMELRLLSALKEYDSRTTARLDRHSTLILDNIKAISKLEAIVPRAEAQRDN